MPQLILEDARKVFERTLADKTPGFGGYRMAKFTVEQHMYQYNRPKSLSRRVNRKALQRILSIIATW